MTSLTGQQLQAAVAHLDQAIYSHEQWCRNLNRVLIARVPPDEPDLEPDAHHRCRFGQWYDGEEATPLRENPSFVAIGDAHEQMHESAARLLQRSVDELPISPADLDQFNNLLDRMRLEIQALRSELTETLENRDPLTGARNRSNLLADLREQQALVGRGLQECTLAMVDLDHGGEEFLLLLPEADLETAQRTAERLREEIAAVQVANPNGDGVLEITASFGLTPLDARRPVEQSIDRADRAMYEAKAAGRDCVMTVRD